jgi:hypothetical protein
MPRLTISMLALLAATAGVSAAPIALERGINVHEWLNWAPLADDGTYRQPPYSTMEEWLTGYRPLSDWPAGDQLERIAGFGFDFIRLTVDPGPMLAASGSEREAAFDVIADGVQSALDAGLKVVVNYHPNSQVEAYSAETIGSPADTKIVADYIAMVAETAARLETLGVDRVAIEPTNEPAYYPCDTSGSEDWQQIAAAQVAAIRAVSPEITIVVTGACGGSVTGLTDLDPGAFDDENLYYSFHMYEPHAFTHQRLDGGFASGLPWPATARERTAVEMDLSAAMLAAGRNTIEQQWNWLQVNGEVDNYYAEDWGMAQLEARFAEATDWAARHGIETERLFMGEFGVIDLAADRSIGARQEDRDRYLEAVRTLAETQGIPWAFWEYSNPWGMSLIEPVGPAEPDASLFAPLGLDLPQ